ncbi:double-strand break repair protein AddB [Rhizobium sp. CFBP 8762]|uniref:double-strand break repair protein AddB n=1 Tax=Rhizobium sp. CFBP 8762 TaxID=2775279 RepID=UPI001785E599|nr:double-strand break repair protein AddB [Rhizobium sp. CFBP 8762]MBD8556784.1 double-strand break repair protein AddB [Rhizobium sp. CFBP 8762]
MSEQRQNVFTIPSGLPFLRTFVSHLCSGDLVPGLRHDPGDPLSLAGATIFVPTRRAARVLRSELVDCLGGRSAILPIIRALGETDDDSGFFDAETPAILDLVPPLSNTARLIELGRLILAWRNQLPKVILDIHTDSPLVAPASPADAIWLARNLSELIDAMETEELGWDALDALDASDHAIWWQLTLEFLKIASTFWPERLTELKQSSPARHRNAILEAEAERLLAGKSTGPIIIAGSTGSIPATAHLMIAVQSLPNGTIVLPGLDQTMSDDDWTLIAADMAAGTGKPDQASRSHPQYGFFRLLRRMGLDRLSIPAIGTVAPDLAHRTDILSQALLPVKATSNWSAFRTQTPSDEILSAFHDVALIEAPNEREEATAIAIALRLGLDEDENSQAALITPDRDLARRVASELMRFGIEADDSAGTPLSATPQGTLTRLLLEAALRPGDPVAIVAVLKHPLARFGLPRDVARQAADALELIALRSSVGTCDICDLEPLLTGALARIKTEHRPPVWRTSLPDTAPSEAMDLARRMTKAVEPLTGAFVRHAGTGRRLTMTLTLAEWATRTGEALEAMAQNETGDLSALWSGEAGEALANLLRSIIESEGQMEADGPQWSDIMESLTASEAIKPRSMRHPRVFIFGALESRLQSMDLVVIGGLNEGTWPGSARNDPFLSRTMKTTMGLEPPERRIGQLAHDFQMACGTRKLVFTRSLRKGSAPTVASRWLQRLLAVGDTKLANLLRDNGTPYLEWAQILDHGDNQDIAERPEPKPPLDLQPKSYSFSEVGKLRRDPYAVYAKRILRVQPVDPFNRDPGAAERGSLYHAIIEQFTKEMPDFADGKAEAAMQRIMTELFNAENLPAHIDVVWRPRFAGVAKSFLNWEKERRPLIKHTFAERRASLEIGVSGIKLTGIADRIDILKTGGADLIDYKTGLSPSVREAFTLLDPQLSLEAAALQGGAFGSAVGIHQPQGLVYVRLRPGERFRVEEVNNDRRTVRANTDVKSAAQLGADSLNELTKLLALLTTGKRGFVSRLIVQKERDYGNEYDHLARVAEWATAETEDDGDDG